jgi:hypothetical protein
MLKQIQKFVSSTMSKNKETFGDNKSTYDAMSLLIALLIVVLLQLFIGKYLWNNYLVKFVPVVKPVDGVVDILAISLLYRLLFN